MVLKFENLKIEWVGHACFKICNKKILYFDPFRIVKKDRADFILISHNHFDHCSIEDIQKIAYSSSKIYAPEQCREALEEEGLEAVYMKPGDKDVQDGVVIEAVPAYNIGKSYHPKNDGNLGFVVTIDGVRIYHSGDTDLIPEMSNLKQIDIAFLPVGGTYTMDAAQASKAASIIKPKVAIPMHYGSIVGSKKDAEEFRSLSQVRVEIL